MMQPIFRLARGATPELAALAPAWVAGRLCCSFRRPQLTRRRIVRKRPRYVSSAPESQRICPKCRLDAVGFAMRRTHLDWVRRFAGLQPFRCRSCRHRFYRFRMSDDVRAGTLYVTKLVSKLGPITHSIKPISHRQRRTG